MSLRHRLCIVEAIRLCHERLPRPDKNYFISARAAKVEKLDRVLLRY